uniref:hypothetical protein n=1 Tax=Candidatus Electronema sp. TaxID=2698783 RepID=UPI00405701BF
MSKIVQSGKIEFQNPALKTIAKDIVDQFKITMDKVVLNHFEPDIFHIDVERPGVFERKIFSAFRVLPEEKKKTAYAGAKKRFSASAEEKRIFGSGETASDELV